jgi:Protein of unknown function (DUF3052)
MKEALKWGYSGNSLEKKLGIKENFKVRLIHAPTNYFDLFTEWPKHVEISDDPRVKKNFIHLFAREFSFYFTWLPLLKEEIEQNGMIWVSWPKKTSKILSDVSEDLIRNYALETGMVDVKVCSVSEEWSALKLVIPLKHRK